MSSTEQAVAGAPIIKDVDQLKANLKDEKRARAESEKPTEPTLTTTSIEATDGSAPESERRKRRKTGAEESEGEILDGPLPVPVHVTDSTKAEKSVIDPAKSEKVSTDELSTKSPTKAVAATPQDPVTQVIDDAEKPKTGESACLGTETTNKIEPDSNRDEPASIKQDSATTSISTKAETSPSAQKSASTPVATLA